MSMVKKSHERRLRDANAAAQHESRNSKGIDKRVTTFKGESASKDTSGTGALDTGPMTPTPEQLEKINRFTRTAKTADELVVFPTLSCNDLYDRDDERFVTDTVKEFASLPEPYGPVGKSYMVGHDYTKLPVGRIFDTSTETIDGALFLKNKVYIPKTASNETLIENIDFGVNWAVSVGVMLESSECGLTFCGAPMSGWGWCYEGHDKGYFYVEDGETDSWGYPLPVDGKTAGAQKCIGLMKGAKDFFELSQVFLGAQFYAALEKQPGFSGVIKAASAAKVPLLGLSQKEAAALSEVMPHLDGRAAHALKAFGATWDADGVLKWTDDQKLVWTYDPAEAEGVMCLGKEASSNDEDDDEEDGTDGSSTQEQPDEDALGSDDAVVDEPASEAVGVSEGDDAGDGGTGTGEVSEGGGSDGEVDPATTDAEVDPDDETEEEKAVSKASVLKCLRTLKAPSTVLSAVESATGDSLDAALTPLLGLVASQSAQIVTLSTKADLGDAYLASQRAEAIDWYVRANAVEGKGVNTDQFQKMLDQCGDNLELIKSLANMQKELAQAKFPGAVRRSSFPSDANKASEPKALTIEGVESADSKVSRLHG